MSIKTLENRLFLILTNLNLVFLTVFSLFYSPGGGAAFVTTGAAISSKTSSIYTIIAAIIFDLIYILAVSISIKNRHEIKAEAKIEYEESKKRLQNYNYAIALKKAGFVVPEEYLPSKEEIEKNAKAKEDALKAFNQTFIQDENDKFVPQIQRVSANEWRCQLCGRVNQDYVGTCACGQPKPD